MSLQAADQRLAIFRFRSQLSCFNPLPVGRYTNYNELRNVNVSQPITIRWESMVDVDFISFWVDSYNNGQTTKFFDDVELDLPATTSYTIPVGTLGGNPNGPYEVWARFTRIDLIVDSTTFSE